MSLWKSFGYSAMSPIDELLAKPDCTLKMLLDEPDIVQECKSQNRALLDLFVTPPTRSTPPRCARAQI